MPMLQMASFGGIQPQSLLGGVTQAQVTGNTATSGGPLKEPAHVRSVFSETFLWSDIDVGLV